MAAAATTALSPFAKKVLREDHKTPFEVIITTFYKFLLFLFGRVLVCHLVDLKDKTAVRTKGLPKPVSLLQIRFGMDNHNRRIGV